MKNLKTWCLAFVAVFGVASGASASVLVSKPLNFAATGFGPASSNLSQIAENFTLSTAVTANQLTFFGASQNTNFVDSFTVEFFKDSGHMPTQTAFFSMNTGNVTGTFAGTFTIGPYSYSPHAYTVSLGAVNLEAGDYWISVWGADLRSQSFQWAHSTNNGDGVVDYRLGNAGPWAAFPYTNDTQAFILEGVAGGGNGDSSVPEPTTLALFGVALAALGFRQRKTPQSR